MDNNTRRPAPFNQETMKHAQIYTVDDIQGLDFTGLIRLFKAVYQRKCLRGTCVICDAERERAKG